MRPLLALVLVLLALGAGLPWWSGWSGGAAGLPGAPRVAMGAVATLDPTQVSRLDELRLLDALFEPLVRLDTATQALRPALAARWEVSADGRTWTFHLAPRRWSDGGAVTAEQVATGLRRHIAGSATTMPAIAAVAAPDATTLTITCVRPVPYLPQVLASPVFIPWHPRFDDPGVWADPLRLPTCGPLACTGWLPRHHYDLEPAPWYDGPWRARGALRLLVVEDSGAALRLYLDRQLDAVLVLSSDSVGDLRRAGRDDLRQGPSWGIELIRLRCAAAPNGKQAGGIDPRLRQALARAVDREALVRDLLHGNGAAASTLVPPSAAGLGYVPPTALLATDLPAARAAVDAVRAEAGGILPPLELLMPANQPERVRIAEWLCDRWRRDLGVDVRLASVPANLAITRSRALDYDLVRGSLVGDYLDPSYFLGCFRGASGMNRTGWNDAEYEQLLDQAESDPTRRMDLLARAEARLLAAPPLIPLYQYACSFLVRPELVGVQPNPLEQVHLSEVGWR